MQVGHFAGEHSFDPGRILDGRAGGLKPKPNGGNRQLYGGKTRAEEDLELFINLGKY